MSCGRSRQSERNSCLVSVGRVTVTLPHHPVRLHGVMQRQAKRISSTMFELLRSSPAMRTNSHSLNFAENTMASTGRMATTPTTCSTTTTTASDTTGQMGQPKPPHTFGSQTSNVPVRLSTLSSSSPPLVFSLLAVAQGLTLNVALHPTLTAIYHMDPIYFVGQLGPRGHVDINLTDHSLSLKSLRPPVNFPQSIRLPLPRIVTTVVRRISSGGRYARGFRKEPLITEGLTAEQGLYLDIQVMVNTLEQTLTTDMLNYIVVVVKLFMREINEVIQKMAGEEQSVRGAARPRPSSSSAMSNLTGTPKATDTDWFLSRAARGKTKFTIRIHMKEIQLMATTLSGAMKLEAKKIDVELTNRVSQASINSSILTFQKTSMPENSTSRGPPRPSNLNLCSTSVPHWSSSVDQTYPSEAGSGESLFIYVSVGHLCAELGYLDQTPAVPVVEPSARRSPVHKTSISESLEHQYGLFESSVPTISSSVDPPTTGLHSDAEVTGTNATGKETHTDGSTASTLFLQLNVEELGVCFPINVLQPSVQSMEADSRTALVLTLDRSRISACYRESLVSQSEFTDFCLRFDDEFNVGSDDWRPDWKRATVDVKGKPHLVILNACVVPSGTFNVCWRDVENRAQWYLIIRWQMRGLDFHLDDNIGRRIKALMSIVTRITGYKGAAPLLATSAEEEEEEFANISPAREDPQDTEARLKSDATNWTKHPLSLASVGGSRYRPRRSMTRGLSDRISDNTSLDDYVPPGNRKKPLPEDLLPDLAQVRSMEFLKHKQELLEAQYCQAFKRQKWNTLRRRGPTLSRSPLLQTRLTGSNSIQRIGPLPATSDRSDKIPAHPSSACPQIASFRSTLLESNTGGSEPTDLGPSRNIADTGRRLSLLSGNDSIYFDIDRDRDAAPRIGDQTLELSSSYESVTGDQSVTMTYRESQADRRSDLWFDPLENPDASQLDNDLLATFPDECFPSEGLADSSSDSDELEQTIRPDDKSVQLGTDNSPLVATDKPVQPPPPPPRRTGLIEAERPPRILESDQTKETAIAPKVHLKVEVQIHVDSGCCVLHPRLPNKGPNSDVDLRSGIDPNMWGTVIPPMMHRRTGSNNMENSVLTSPRGNLHAVFPSRPTLECGLRSMGELLPRYQERYKRYLLQDPQFFSTDLSVFYLPAVDIGLHYNSMTEVDLQSSAVETFGIHPRPNDFIPFDAGPMKSTNARPSQTIRSVSPKTEFRGRTEDVTVSEPSRCNLTSPSQAAPVSSGLKKQAELYISFFLQKLPQELVIHPALLDFLEQALENIPLVTDTDADTKSLSSEEEKSTNEEKKRSNDSISGPTSSPSLDGILSETFPVHTVVHLHVQPSAVRLLCLPTSRMQCLMVLPFLDAVFSTKRNPEEQQSELENTGSDSEGVGRSTTSSEPANLRSDINARGTAVRVVSTPNTPGDAISEGGLCVTAILKEFRISVFHPFGDMKTNRTDTGWGPTWSGDSLTLLIRDIQFSLSRVVQLNLIQLGPSAVRGPGLETSGTTAFPTTERPDSARGRYLTPGGATALTSSISDTWGLHRAVRFSGVFDIGAAVFTCDTRRTLEILDIPKAWYRSSLARRLFLGNEDVLADGFPPSEMKKTQTASDDSIIRSTNETMTTEPGDGDSTLVQSNQNEGSSMAPTVDRRKDSVKDKGKLITCFIYLSLSILELCSDKLSYHRLLQCYTPITTRLQLDVV
ncbi:unnamed protein product [Echinostoma caproni]|uniref:Bridge-like lipid transfer protein family member 1 C-terminal domain-containing protein n=1 Tax=Echinostoma caproni TaxID=27848 RepID=A0A3P8HLK0_9TREM|nr:unnamed protein product [Echinostoma caproni]